MGTVLSGHSKVLDYRLTTFALYTDLYICMYVCKSVLLGGFYHTRASISAFEFEKFYYFLEVPGQREVTA